MYLKQLPRRVSLQNLWILFLVYFHSRAALCTCPMTSRLHSWIFLLHFFWKRWITWNCMQFVLFFILFFWNHWWISWMRIFNHVILPFSSYFSSLSLSSYLLKRTPVQRNNWYFCTSGESDILYMYFTSSREHSSSSNPDGQTTSRKALSVLLSISSSMQPP